MPASSAGRRAGRPTTSPAWRSGGWSPRRGAATTAGLYLQDELATLAALPQVHVTPTVLESDGPIDQVVVSRHPKVSGWRAFLCGDPSTVQGLRKKLFLAGAALNDIHADAFLPSSAPATAGAP